MLHHLRLVLIIIGLLVVRVRSVFDKSFVDKSTTTKLKNQALEDSSDNGGDGDGGGGEPELLLAKLPLTAVSSLEPATLPHRQLQTDSIAYAVSFVNDEDVGIINSLHQVDLDEGSLTFIDTVTNLIDDDDGTQIVGLTFCGGELYALTGSPTLYTLDMTNAEATVVNTFPTDPRPQNPQFIASTSIDGECMFYTSSYDGVYMVFEFSATTNPVELFDSPAGGISGGAIDCEDDDLLWTVDPTAPPGLQGDFISIDLTTGIPQSFTFFENFGGLGLAFDCCDRQLYGVDRDVLYAINTTTAVATVVNENPGTDIGKITSLAIATAASCLKTPTDKCFVDKDYPIKIHHGSSAEFLGDVEELHVGELCSYSKYSAKVCCEVAVNYDYDRNRSGIAHDDDGTSVECASCHDCIPGQAVNDACCARAAWTGHYDYFEQHDDSGDNRHLMGVFKGGCIDRHGTYSQCCKCDGWYDCAGPNADCSDVCDDNGPPH